MKHKILFFATIITILLSGCAAKEVIDENVNAYSFSAVAESVQEGDDIPVHLYFSDGGLIVDNPSWGDKWKGATFYAEMKDSRGRTVDNAVYSGPGGVIANGSVLDISSTGKMDIVVGALREGTYTLDINMKTRYTVDTWASTTITVRERTEAPVTPPAGDIYVDDFTVPSSSNGLEIDNIGNIVLDLRIFNADNPFKFRSTVRPDDATNKQLVAASGDPSLAAIRVESQTILVITPVKVGTVAMTVRSADGNAQKSFGVRVIETLPDTEGFTLPSDDSEKGNYDFDVAGRLQLDINEWNDGNPFQYTCKPIPSDAAKPSLVASSDTPEVVTAVIRDGNRLVLVPKKPGYAVITVSTTDGDIVRQMRVAVVSKFNIIVDAVEDAQSDDDKKSGVFPCRLTVKTSSKYTPSRLRVQVYAKATGRVDLTDPADYFKVDSLKNSRTAYYSYQDKIPVLYQSSGNSAYDLYNRVMKKISAMGVVIHHSADWPNYKDYISYFRLYKIDLGVSVIEEFDTNLYQVTLQEKYNSPEHKLYQYLF